VLGKEGRSQQQKCIEGEQTLGLKFPQAHDNKSGILLLFLLLFQLLAMSTILRFYLFAQQTGAHRPPPTFRPLADDSVCV